MKSSYYENTKNTEYDSDILPFLYPNDLNNLGWGKAENDTILGIDSSELEIDKLWNIQTQNDYYPLSFSQKNYSSETSNSITQWKRLEDKTYLTAGTRPYVERAVGQELFESLSQSDQDFLIKASNMLNLGEDVDIDKILKTLNDPY